MDPACFEAKPESGEYSFPHTHMSFDELESHLHLFKLDYPSSFILNMN